MMALLGPGVGKKYMDAGQAGRRDHVRDNVHRVVLDDADIGQSLRFDQPQQSADTRRMHFDAEVVVLRMVGRDPRSGFPHAETDFEKLRCAAGEGGVEVEWRGAISDAEKWQQ